VGEKKNDQICAAMSRLTPALRTAFAEHGVDICEPFNVLFLSRLKKDPLAEEVARLFFVTL
jgi:hypothetical protein